MSETFKVPTLDYTDRDYKAVRDSAIRRIPFFTEEWTDHSDTDPGIVMLQEFAGMMDVGHFYLDQKLRESLITTVRGRRTATYLAALVGQRLKGKAPSVVFLDFTIPVQAESVPIPIGTIVSTSGINPTVFFETTEAVTIPAGATGVTGVRAVSGLTASAQIGVSNGQEFQEFEVPATNNVLDAGFEVTVGATQYTLIEALGQAGPDDEVFTYRRTEDNRVFIQFGWGTENGGNGKIPPNADLIAASWREGGGRASNVGVDTVRSVVSTLTTFPGGSPVTATVTNPDVASGGDEEETVALARRRVPRAFRANNRGVIGQDYEALAEGVPGVLQAKALVSGINQWTVYILPNPSVGVGVGNDPFGFTVLDTVAQSQAALALYVKDQIEGKTMQTDSVDVKVVNYRPIDIVSDVTLLPGANKAQVRLALQQFAADFFDPRLAVIGDNVNRRGDAIVSDWDAGIAPGADGVGGIPGVDFIDTTIFQLRPLVETINAIGQPQFSTIEYSVFTTDAFWEVQFLDNLTYRVFRQELSGGPKVVQSAIGTLGATFNDDNNEISMVVILPGGAIAPTSGDLFRFRSTAERGNVRILLGEVIAQGGVSFNIIGGAV